MLVSIITPSFNSSRFIEETIMSVISQTYKDWEMIIVDDCSSDNSVELVNKFTMVDNRIKLITLNENVGAAEARNIALRQASGRFIAFLDSDDIWYKQKLEKQLRFMTNNNAAFSFTAYEVININGSSTKKIIEAPLKMDYNCYLGNTVIGCLTVIIDKYVTGDFLMPHLKSSHDMALWLSFLKRGIYAYGLNECLAKYRLVSSSNTSNKFRAAKDVWKVYRSIEHINVLMSIFYFVRYSVNAILKRV